MFSAALLSYKFSDADISTAQSVACIAEGLGAVSRRGKLKGTRIQGDGMKIELALHINRSHIKGMKNYVNQRNSHEHLTRTLYILVPVKSTARKANGC